MNGIFNFIITIVAIGIVSLFATFFIIVGLHKREFWEELHKKYNFKEKE